METFGISKKDAPYFMPPYEWYNQQISDWVAEFGLQIVNFTPGTSSNADYTTPEMPNYISSDSIYARILRYESTRSAGLNGFILLVHIGTSERRTDKFYSHLDRLMAELLRRGYSFRRL
jgi:peptidoglycan/xylan/chitin deacetylase (PgdA/CDA1 family)